MRALPPLVCSYEELQKAGVNVDFKTYQYMGAGQAGWTCDGISRWGAASAG